jgi:hypothetical protein
MLYFAIFMTDSALTGSHDTAFLRIPRTQTRPKQPAGHDRVQQEFTAAGRCSDYRLRPLNLMHHRSPLEGSLMKLFAIGIAVILAGFIIKQLPNEIDRNVINHTMILLAQERWTP